MNTLFIILLIGLIILFIYVKIKFKVPKIGSLTVVTGGVKTGKSTLSVYLAWKNWKKNTRRVKIANFFRRIFRKKEYELPLLVSNIPLNIPYVPFDEKIALREIRLPYYSVIYCCEASFFASADDYKDKYRNALLTMFNKLIGHQYCQIIYDTQSIADCHFAIKKCCSNYFYIRSTNKWLPFFLKQEIIEQRYSYDNSTITAFNTDLDEVVKVCLIPKKVWKLFDAHCYSIGTDFKPCLTSDNLVKADTLKATTIVTFDNTIKDLYEKGLKNEKEKNQ